MRSWEQVLMAGLVLGSSWSGAAADDPPPPTVVLTAPAAGTLVKEEVVSLQADVTGDVHVASVEFLVNGRSLGADSTAPYSANWDLSQVENGSYTLTNRVYVSASSSFTGAPVSVSVDIPHRATLSPVFHVPTCASQGPSCDTMDLARARSTSEPNSPNTLDGCADGPEGDRWSGNYPMILRTRLTRVNGESLAEGRKVRVDVTALTYEHEVELYFTNDAMHPSWTYLTSLTPQSWGTEVLSTEYVLPTGSMQALRARIRETGAPGACDTDRANPTPDHDDVDDVVFAVGAPTDTLPPVVTLTHPTATSLGSGIIPLSATADDDMAVERVEFFVDGVLLGTDRSAPYEASWNTASGTSGPHTLLVKAYDFSGHIGTAQREVDTDISPPSVVLTWPVDNNAVAGTLTLQANASDNVRVKQVEFLDGTRSLGADASSPYATTWYTTPEAAGFHTLTVRAYDAVGNVTTSAQARVFVDNTPPTTTLTVPANVGGTVELSATASDNLAVLFVDFYAGSTLISRDTTPPYTASWNTTGLPDGFRSVYARATDSARNVGSVDRTVTVDNTPPSVQIIAPANGASVFLSTPFNVNTGDNTGISRVEFYDGGKLLGTDTTASYGMTWTLLGVSKGMHTLTAKAYDLAGNLTTSAPITVKVN